MKVYEALAVACRRQGADVAFGLVGDGNVKFAHHWAKECGGRYVAARHETGAVAMAFGYARSTGRTGLATVTQGPGLTNALTAVAAAARGREPLVLVAGLPPTGLPGHPQRIDQHALLATAGAGVQDIDPEHVLRDVTTAFERARRERRPIGICVPTDVQDSEGEDLTLEAADAGATAGPWEPVQRLQPAAGAIAAACDAVMAARRPLVVAGRGVLGSPGAREALERLADRIGALLATTLPIRGYFAGHRYDLGVIGGFASALASAEAGRADLVLVFGGSLNYRATRSGTLFDDAARIIQCDVLAEPAGASVDVHQRLQGDAAVTASALEAELAERRYVAVGARTPALAERLRSGDVHAPLADRSPEGKVDPRSLMLRLEGPRYDGDDRRRRTRRSDSKGAAGETTRGALRAAPRRPFRRTRRLPQEEGGMTTEWTRGEFTVSTDPRRIDLDRVHEFLATSYWAEGIPREVVRRSIENSLCFGLYLAGRQVGFARVITDRATFAYLGDVFVLEEFRGRGLARWLLEVIQAHPELQGFRRWVLLTRDAHELYRQAGWTGLAAPDRYMERWFKDAYRPRA